MVWWEPAPAARPLSVSRRASEAPEGHGSLGTDGPPDPRLVPGGSYTLGPGALLLPGLPSSTSLCGAHGNPCPHFHRLPRKTPCTLTHSPRAPLLDPSLWAIRGPCRADRDRVVGRAWGGTPVGTSQGTPSRGAGVCLQRPPGGTGRPCPQPKPPFRPSSGQQVKRGVPGEKERRTQERKANPGQSGAGGSEGRPQPAHCPRPPRPPPAELPGRL